jgi:hypothetical protein
MELYLYFPVHFRGFVLKYKDNLYSVPKHSFHFILIHPPLVYISRSEGHVGTTSRFRSFSDTFTQRFQNKSPFFSWC